MASRPPQEKIMKIIPIEINKKDNLVYKQSIAITRIRKHVARKVTFGFRVP